MEIMSNRYTVSCQDKSDPQCYHDEAQYETFIKAKEAAEALTQAHGRPCIIFDAREGFVVFKTATTESLPKQFAKRILRKRRA